MCEKCVRDAARPFGGEPVTDERPQINVADLIEQATPPEWVQPKEPAPPFEQRCQCGNPAEIWMVHRTVGLPCIRFSAEEKAALGGRYASASDVLGGREQAPYATESAKDIVEHIVPQVLGHFLPKNADYGDQHRTGLGPKGEYVGLHRKMAKLERSLWDGKPMNHEGPEEMILDIIGACFLILDLFRQEAIHSKE